MSIEEEDRIYMIVGTIGTSPKCATVFHTSRMTRIRAGYFVVDDSIVFPRNFNHLKVQTGEWLMNYKWPETIKRIII